MVDINLLRSDPDRFRKATADKQIDSSIVEKTLELDKKYRDVLIKTEDLRAERNITAKSRDIEKGKEIKNKLKTLEPELKQLEEEFKKLVKQIPNPAQEDVKVGANDTENEITKTWGEKTHFDFEPKDHLELGEKLDIIDVARATKVSGARFYYLKGDGVRLEMALIQYAFDTLGKEGFVPIMPPALIRKESMDGMGYLEHGGEEDMFTLDKDGLILVGTSEQSIGPMHMDEKLDFKNGPIRYMGYSPCFRREAGSYGKDTRGILRVHQFNKVEMFSFTRQEDGEAEHELLLSLEEKLFQGLQIPHQVVKMCTGDLGAPAARKYDIEAWIPTQEKYREVTSTSTTTDFQSRRLNIKYDDKGESKFAHMLNGTAFATGRTMIAIMENNQNEDGSINIPEVLQKYMGKERIDAE